MKQVKEWLKGLVSKKPAIEEEWTLNIKPRPIEESSFYVKLPKSMQKNITEALKVRRKEIKEHFNKDGWRLDFDFLRFDLLEAMFGTDFFREIAEDVLNEVEGVELYYDYNECGGFKIRKLDRVFYCAELDKIEVAKVAPNASYVEIGEL